MGKEQAIQEFEQAKKEKLAQSVNETIKTVLDVRKKKNRLADNLSKILRERFELRYKKGDEEVVRIIEGYTGDKSKGTVGTSEVFATDEFRGHPFDEVSRNMANHFKLYCLVNGVSDAEMMAMAQENPPKEIVDKIAGCKEKFFDMVANKDMDAIKDYYVKMAIYIYNKLPDIMSLDDSRNVKRNADNMVLLSGNASFVQQTINLNDLKKRTPDQNKLVEAVNNELKRQGRQFMLNDIEHALYPMEVLTSSLDGINVEIATNLTYDQLHNPNIEDDEDYSISAANNVTLKLGLLTMLTREAKEEALKNGLDVNEKFVFMDSGIKSQEKEWQYTAKDIFKDVLSGMGNAEPDQVKEARSIADRMKGNVRKGLLWGTKDNSPEYDDVLNAAENIAKIEKEIADSREKGKVPSIKKLNELKKAYETLDSKAKIYLGARNPSSEEGRERYKLVLEAQQMAKTGLERQAQMAAPIERQLKNAAKQVEAAVRFRQEEDILHKNFADILKEPFTHVDVSGVERKIEGDHGDKEKGTMGLIDLLESKEFKHKPFGDISRKTGSHFKMYCLANGLTEKELSELSKPDVPEELKNKLRGMKKGFMDMIINKDLEKISEIYKDIALLIDADKKLFMNLTPGNIDKNEILFLKYGDMVAWGVQTFNLGKDMTEEQKKVVENVNKKLADAGKSFKFNNLNIIQRVTSVVEGAKNDNPKPTETMIIAKNSQSRTAHINIYTNIMSMHHFLNLPEANQPGREWLSVFPDRPEDILAPVQQTLIDLTTNKMDIEDTFKNQDMVGRYQEPENAKEYEFVPLEGAPEYVKKVENPDVKKEEEPQVKEPEQKKESEFVPVEGTDYVKKVEKKDVKEEPDKKEPGPQDKKLNKAGNVIFQQRFSIKTKATYAFDFICSILSDFNKIRNDLGDGKPFDAEKARICLAKQILANLISKEILVAEYQNGQGETVKANGPSGKSDLNNSKNAGPIETVISSQWGNFKNHKRDGDMPAIRAIMNTEAFKNFTKDITAEKLSDILIDGDFGKLQKEIAKEKANLNKTYLSENVKKQLKTAAIKIGDKTDIDFKINASRLLVDSAQNDVKNIEIDLDTGKKFDADKARICIAKMCLINMIDKEVKATGKGINKTGPVEQAVFDQWEKVAGYGAKEMVDVDIPAFKNIMNNPVFKEATKDMTPEKLTDFINNKKFEKLEEKITESLGGNKAVIAELNKTESKSKAL